MLLEPSERLRKAVIEGNLLTVKRLLRRFPELLRNIDPRNGWSSLHYASYHGRYLICVYLIKQGHDKHELIETFKGNTCVHLALIGGHEQTTHLLLQHFPTLINGRGEYGRVPAHFACMYDYPRCLALLMAAGANLTLTDDLGDTPLHICLQYGSTNCMKSLVLEGGLDSDAAQDSQHWKPSDVAESFEFLKMYQRTLKQAKDAESIGRKSSFQSFKTPLLIGKSTFDDAPSPALNKNHQSTPTALLKNTQLYKSKLDSPHKSFIGAQDNTLEMPSISNPALVFKEKGSIVNNIAKSNFEVMGKVSNGQNNKTLSLSTTNPLDEKILKSPAILGSPKKKIYNDNQMFKGGNNPLSSLNESVDDSNSANNTELINKYLASDKEVFIPPEDEAFSNTTKNASRNDYERQSNISNGIEPKRHTSLLNIKISKLRLRPEEESHQDASL